MKGIFKTLMLLTMVVVVGSLAGCNSKQPEPKPIDPPIQEEETQNVQLLAPTIWVSPELVLQINPNSDAKTQEKTTGYEVTINYKTQMLTKDELSLQLELAPGDDVIEVKAIGGEKTESKQVAPVIVTEEQKAIVAYNQAIGILKNSLEERINELTNKTVQNFELKSIYKNGNNLHAVINFKINETGLTRTMVMENIVESYENIFDLLNIVKNNNIKDTIQNDTVNHNYNGGDATNSLLNGNYLENTSIGDYLNNGWTALIIDQNMSAIGTATGNFNGLDGYHRFNTTAIIKLEKDGSEDIYLNTSYRVSIDRSYDKFTLIESIANGTINATHIIIDNENVTVLEKANIYQDAKEAYEGKTAETIHGQVQEAA